ncbi:unnamed protein product [Schistosoma margrebowiei]|uniref:Uncharacterized protein n=1 Tax=Schistosoma margrebowiei TaxID=48269 RepID=A0A183N7M3_9TREM|nr:unnamed protein product [Schistosoma margrebowiei]
MESSRPKEKRNTKEHTTPGNGDRREKNEQECDRTRKKGPGQNCFKQRKDSQFFHIFNDYRLNIKILFSSLIIIMLITWSIFYVIIPNKTSTTTTNNNGIDPFNTNNPLFDSELVFVETLDITITTRMFTNWTFKRRLLIDLKQNNDKFC